MQLKRDVTSSNAAWTPSHHRCETIKRRVLIMDVVALLV